MNTEFQIQYQEYYEEFKGNLIDLGFEQLEVNRYCTILLNRLLMLCFIQEQGWLDGKKRFLQWFIDQFEKSSNSESFHTTWINTLLFNTLNIPPCARILHPELPIEVSNALRRMPYLNDGLFEKLDLDHKNVQIPDETLKSVISGLITFEYTTLEHKMDTRSDHIDPSILGQAYELLLFQGTKESEGVVYTPKSEVDLICRLALYSFILEGPVLDLTSSEKGELEKLRRFENRNELLDLIFTPLETYNSIEFQDYNILRKLVHKVRIVDPACGSGAFLVGMLLLQIEILEKLGETSDFQTRAKLVQNCLHGADLDDWAIRLTEFRLWMVIAQGEASPLRQPVLPNLGLNLIAGDSVVQEVNKQYFSLNGYRGKISENMKELIETIQNLRNQYFEGDSLLRDDIHQEQVCLIEAYLKENIPESLNETLSNLMSLEERVFLWDLSFPHIMLAGGFDLAIVNPPYVRSEQIGDDVEYKQKLQSYILNYHGKVVSGRSDLYLYFFFKILEILQPGGCFVFITSNSWLDVEFGLTLQEKFLESTDLRILLESSVTRAFPGSSINTVITAGRKRVDPSTGLTLFLTLKETYGLKTRHILQKGLLDSTDIELLTISGVPVEISESNQLKRVSIKTESLSRVGTGKWGRLLRAPAVFFKISEGENDILTTLGEIAELKRGLTTGANEFFYLPKPGCTNKYFRAEYDSSTGCLLLHILPEVSNLFQKQSFTIKTPMFRIERQYWMHEANTDSDLKQNYEIVYNTNESFWVPNYVVKGPKEIESILVNPRKLNHVVLLVHEPEELLEPGIQEYIRWGELFKPEIGGRYPDRSTCRSRQLWYDLGYPTLPNLLWIKGIWERHLVAFANRMCYIDQQLYGIYVEEPSLLYTTLGILNSTLTALFAELTGRSNLGEGVLWTATYEAESIPTLKAPDSRVIELVEKIISKPVRSIFEEIEPDKKELDSLFMGLILGLSDQEQFQVYKNVQSLVNSRLRKAKNTMRNEWT